jgi:hypothetical protein
MTEYQRRAIAFGVVAEGTNPKVLAIIRTVDSLNRAYGRDCTCHVLQQSDGCPTAWNVAGRRLYFYETADRTYDLILSPRNEGAHRHQFGRIKITHHNTASNCYTRPQ